MLIKEDDEKLEELASALATKEGELSAAQKEFEACQSKTYINAKGETCHPTCSSEKSVFDGISYEISDLERQIDNLTGELEQLSETANAKIQEIKGLDGSASSSTVDVAIDTDKISNIGVSVVDYTFFGDPFDTEDKGHWFMGWPYSKRERYGRGFVVTLADGRSFPVYHQPDRGGYEDWEWVYYLAENGFLEKTTKQEIDKIRANGGTCNPMGSGCSTFATASALSLLTGKNWIDPTIAFHGGGQWNEIINVLGGIRVFEMIDDKTAKLMKCKLDSEYTMKDYMGDRFDIENRPEGEPPRTQKEQKAQFKQDIYDTLNSGGVVMYNSSAPGFSIGQHYGVIMGTDENGYVIIADSMYNGYGSKYSSLEYNPEEPFSHTNCPPYLKYNEETGEPFKIDDMVDHCIKKAKADARMNSYCCINSVEIKYQVESYVPKDYRDDYNTYTQLIENGVISQDELRGVNSAEDVNKLINEYSNK